MPGNKRSSEYLEALKVLEDVSVKLNSGFHVNKPELSIHTTNSSGRSPLDNAKSTEPEWNARSLDSGSANGLEMEPETLLFERTS